jgi:selenide, water dikinase
MKHLVLIGGGHSHAIALRLLGSHPFPNVRITLITDVMDAPYSGMLPGHVGGFYTFAESHIHLQPLAQSAKAHLVLDQAVGLDLQQNQVLCRHHAPIAFDWLSINIGGTPAKQDIPGAAEYTIPAKPVPQFLAGWSQILQSFAQKPTKKPTTPRPISIGIVGGGAGGIELAFAMQARLQEHPVQIHLFHRNQHLMSSGSEAMGKRFEALLRLRGVQIHLGEAVMAVEAEQYAPEVVVCQSGLRVKCDRIFWLTQAVAPAWLHQAGLATDERGFILVNDILQSVSHPHVFATGDIATVVDHPRPKAGVFAVRQGKPLFKNLQRVTLGQPPQPFYPQKRYLALVGTGDGKAIALWNGLSIGPSRWLWGWKDWIDRRFMAQFEP